MSWFKSKGLLDRSFEIGITLKGLDGVLEVVGGLLLLFVSPRTINHLVVALTQSELSEDPHDLIATFLLRSTHHLTGSTVLFGALYLLAHGIVKIVLVAALLMGKLWAYPWMISFLGVFIIYQIYRMTFAPSVGLASLTIFDILIAWLTFLEYRKRRNMPVEIDHRLGHSRSRP